MPTYEYVCSDCDHHLEVVQSFNDDALTECPNCKGELRKVFGSIGIAFKGQGFYKNDSRPQKAIGKSADKSTEKTTPKSDDKPSSAPKAPDTPSVPKSGTSSDTSSAAS